jgi:hypothetical protein
MIFEKGGKFFPRLPKWIRNPACLAKTRWPSKIGRSRFSVRSILHDAAEPADSLTIWIPGMTVQLSEPLKNWLPICDHGDGGALCLPDLVPSRPGPDSDSLLARLRSFSPGALGLKVVSPTDGIALHAGIFQWHDFLDESHELSQSIEGEGPHRFGDYWHAIMHRREPDYSNAKYWFRHVGRSPIFGLLCEFACEVLDSSSAPEAARWRSRLNSNKGWDPFAFVDLCEQCAADEEREIFLAARRIQQQEMTLLIDATWRQCFGLD